MHISLDIETRKSKRDTLLVFAEFYFELLLWDFKITLIYTITIPTILIVK